MPRAPRGLDVEATWAWADRVLAPFVAAERRRQAQRAKNGRSTGRDRQRVERERRFIEQATAIDRRTLIASLDEVDAVTLL
jgi:hypothetical protein